MVFKVGDVVEVVKKESGNFVQPGSYGTITDLNETEELDNYPGEKAYIQYELIIDENGNKHEGDNLKTEQYGGHYYTLISRLKLKAKDWEQRTMKVENYEG
jgi:hypothetical protein